MTTLNTRNFLKWTSIAINIENPTYSKSDCMKLAIKELQKEKKMRKYVDELITKESDEDSD